MASTAATRPPLPVETHQWVGATNVPLDPKSARQAHRRGSLRVPTATQVEVLDVYCSVCRRPYDDCKDHPCPVGDIVLRGGPIGERKKRGKGTGALSAVPSIEC